METKDLSLKIDATKIEVAGIKNKFTAQCKLAYSFIATIATIFATIYSDGKQLVIFSMLLFSLQVSLNHSELPMKIRL
ncbi:hypothetical protein ACVPOQ_14875 [Staphylococcus aureus]